MEKEKLIYIFFSSRETNTICQIVQLKKKKKLIEHFKAAYFTAFVALVGDSTMARVTLAA